VKRRRTVIAVALILGAALFGAVRALPKAGRWLEVSTPLHPADLVVALGGDRARQELAADLFRRGFANRVLFTGADARARDYECLGIPTERAVPLPPPAYTTGEEARAVRTIVDAAGVRSIIVVTAPFHSRRSLAIFRRALRGAGTEVMLAATRNPRYDTDRWWRDHMGVKSVLSEYGGLAYYWLHGWL